MATGGVIPMRLAPLAFGLLLASSIPAFAYTQADANACTNDVFRFCQQAIPDQARITACLFKNRHNVSPACYAVYQRHSRETVGRSGGERKRTY